MADSGIGVHVGRLGDDRPFGTAELPVARLGFGERHERARAGDADMLEITRQAASSVGVGLASLCVLFNPDTAVLGGGVALEAGELFRSQAEQAMRLHAVPIFSRQARVVPATAGPAAGLLGAAAMILFDSPAAQAIG